MKIIFLLFFVFFFGFLSAQTSELAYSSFVEPLHTHTRLRVDKIPPVDSVPLVFYHHVDSAMRTVYFSSTVYTNVCSTGECLPARFTMFWDFTGRYSGYSVPADWPLTKTNHKHFGRKQYDELHKILQDRNSILGQYDAVSQPGLFDAVTGETIEQLEKATVGGAFYTTNTMWRYANGEIATWLGRCAVELNGSQLLFEALGSDTTHYRLWALQYLTTADYDSAYDSVLLSRLSGESAYEALRTAAIFSSSLSTGALTGVFVSCDYGVQTQLIRELHGRIADREARRFVISLLRNEDRPRQAFIVALFQDCGPLPHERKSLRKMLPYLQEDEKVILNVLLEKKNTR